MYDGPDNINTQDEKQLLSIRLYQPAKRRECNRKNSINININFHFSFSVKRLEDYKSRSDHIRMTALMTRLNVSWISYPGYCEGCMANHL